MPRSRAFRPAVLAQDNYTCQATWRCRRKGPRPEKELHADHIVPLWKEGPDDPKNGQTLCKLHHKEKTAKEAGERAGKKEVSRLSQFLIVAIHVFGMYLISRGLIRALQHKENASTIAQAIWCVVILAAFFLGRRAIRQRFTKRPRQTKESAPESFDRIISTAREVMGQKGEIVVYREKGSDYVVSYEGTGFADGDDEKRLELMERLHAKLGGRWRGDWITDDDKVKLHRVEDLSEYVPHPGFTKAVEWFRIQIADIATFDLRQTSHILICGLTNSGKTGLLHSIVAHLSWCVRLGQIETLYILDPKRVELTGWRGMPGIQDVFTEAQTMWDAVVRFADEMDRRYALHEKWERSDGKEGQPLSSHKPWIMLVDEYEEFLEIMQNHADEEVNGKARERTTQKRPATPVRQMARLARLARKAKMHLIVGTQRGDAELIGGRVRNNFGARVLVGRGGSAESIMLFGSSGYGRDVPSVKGRMTVQTGEGKPFEVQGFYFPDPGAEHHTAEEIAIAKRAGLDLAA